MEKKNTVFCAIDSRDIDSAKNIVMDLKGSVGGIKIGLEFFTKFGPDGVKKVMEDSGLLLFLDLKFYDIPNTVAGAVRSAVECGAAMLTIHASGGAAMMEAAVQASYDESLKLGKKRPMIIAVSVLTSMNEDNLVEIGINNAVGEQVVKLGKIAQNSNVDGIVCSAHELKLIRSHLDPQLKTIVPGIRLEKDNSDDQKRIMTPKMALDNGADYLVIGRPITGSANPKIAAENILKSII